MILVPVYFVFLIGLFSIGNLMIVRQALVSTTRNIAWDASQTSTVNVSIDGPYRGSFTVELTHSNDGHLFNEGEGGEVSLDDMKSFAGDNLGVETAQQALNGTFEASGNRAGSPATARKVIGRYRYEGINFGPALTQTTHAAVLLPKKHRRKVYRVDDSGRARADSYTGGKDHVATDWASMPYDPSSTASGNSLPMNPKYKGFLKGDEGIWDRTARINGGVEQEHSFFKSRVTK